jgi:hypothetical protein
MVVFKELAMANIILILMEMDLIFHNKYLILLIILNKITIKNLLNMKNINNKIQIIKKLLK